MFQIIAFISIVIIVISVISTPLFSDAKIENISTKTAVIFNTLCAKCHEGECSGRLSFDTGSEKAKNHIRHYSDSTKLSEDEIKEFFSLLNYMKTKCAIWMPLDTKWKNENLSHFALPSHKGYFIPLGELQSGTYTLLIKTKKCVSFRIEILSDHFDSILDQHIMMQTKENTLHFTIENSTNVFLRIRSLHTIDLLEMTYQSKIP